jgi:hypothetical protein
VPILKLATPQTAWAMPEAAEKPKPMAADADPSFEVVTIKPSARKTSGVQPAAVDLPRSTKSHRHAEMNRRRNSGIPGIS